MGSLAVIDNPIEQVIRFAQGKPSKFGDQREMMVPDIIEFACSDRYLDRPSLYPRQATLLKTIFLQDELYCADEKTEILTRRGWATYDSLVEGEFVLALDHATSLARWVPVQMVNVFPVDGTPMVLRTSVNHSSLTTPDHRWPIERYEQGGGAPRWERTWSTTEGLGCRDRVRCAAPVSNLPQNGVYTDEFVELVAWYWTEGHLKGGHVGVTITQSERVNPEKCERIKMALSKMLGPALEHLEWSDEPAWSESCVRDMAVFRLNRAASDAIVIAAPGAEKVVDPAFITQMTQAQLELFIDVSIMADGSVKNGVREISQSSRRRLDSFQMVCQLAGVRTSLRGRTVGGTGKYAGRATYSLSLQEKRPFKSFQRDVVTDVSHTGVVWCPTTELQSWLARRDGHVYFTGNTSYDYDVLGEWVEGFKYPTRELTEDVTTIHYEGQWGINPDILERMKWLKEHNYRWFQIVCAVQGRRSGKGHIGAICGAYVLWHYLCTGDPQEHYGLAPGKRLASQVFAGKKAQARDNQWRDLVNSILSSNCFTEWINNPLGESITIMAPADKERIASQVDSTLDQATFEIVPKEATLTSGRGPASFMQFYDEMAHMIATGASRSAEEVWNQAQPSLDQFKEDAFIYCGSSPWTMLGKFYALVRESLEVDSRTLKPINPTIMTIQLASWDIYKDWEKTKSEKMVMSPQHRRALPLVDHNDRRPVLGDIIPERLFPPLKVAIQEYDEKMIREERTNPETFAVERRARWATAQDSYFDPAHVDRTFRAWGGSVLTQTWVGLPGVHDYIAHGDPGKCLTAESLMFSTEGIIKIPQVRIGDEIVNSVSTDRVADAFESGVKQVYSLKLKYGYEVRGSEDHPVLTRRGWVRMVDLVASKSRSDRSHDPGADQVKMALGADLWAAEPVAIIKPPVPRRSNGSPMVRCPPLVDGEMGRLFGFIVAEGRVGSADLSLSGHVDEQWMDDCVDIIYRRFGISPDRDEIKGKGRYLHWYNAHLHELLVMLGMTPTHSRDKEIPWAVLQSPRSVVSAFLRAYFEGDGTVSKSSAKDRVVQVTTASQELARQVQVVLANFGIVSQRTIRTHWLDGAGEDRDYWNVTLRGDSIRRFNLSIGFESEEKIARAKSLAEFDCAPTPGEMWLPAWSVDDQGEEMTWDLMMESGEHNFAANGIICHNTSSNFGFAVAHVVPDPDGHAIPHVVFDLVHAWTPGDFPVVHDDGEMHYEMDYETVGNDMKRAFDGFLFTDLSFDQWNSINFVQTLGRYGQAVSYKPTRVWERTTTAQLNWATAETMKVAMSLDRVHMPYFELAEMELKFLRKLPGDKVDHPTSGPVTTKDVYDAISIVVHKAIGGQIASAYGAQFTALQVGAAMPGLSSASDGSTRGSNSRPISDPAVQTLFSRDRDRRSSGRPIPGDIGGRRRPESR